jgi:glycosyltransferase involved in cell wall biosynthesis
MVGESIIHLLDLSVIIITRNEEKRIKDCIESVLHASDFAKHKGVINDYEVILVDSASTDRTVEIAKEYLITLLQLEPHWPLSASAGMYIGCLNSKGKYLAKVDGDSIIDREWFLNAIPSFGDETIGGVTGIYAEKLDEDTLTGRKLIEASLDQPSGEVEVIATGIFRTDAVKKVGNFNPFLKAGEDRDLAYRLKKEGYKLVRLNYKEMDHYYSDTGKASYLQHLSKMYLYSVGDGQAARSVLKNKQILMKHILRYVTIYFAQVYIIILLTIVLLISNWLVFFNQTSLQTASISLVILIIDILILYFVTFIFIVRFKKNKLDEILYVLNAVPYIIVRQTGFIVGLIKGVKRISDYPTNVRIIPTKGKSIQITN